MRTFTPHIYTKEENRDMYLFQHFAQYVPKVFHYYQESEDGTFFDILSTNYTGGTNLCELKYREMRKNIECIFIEPEKYTNLMLSYAEDGYPPLYINFMNGYEDVWIFNLAQVPSLQTFPSVLINGHNVPRFGLNKAYGHHYVWNGSGYDYTPPKGALNKVEKARKLSSEHIDKPINNNNYLRRMKRNERQTK